MALEYYPTAALFSIRPCDEATAREIAGAHVQDMRPRVFITGDTDITVDEEEAF